MIAAHCDELVKRLHSTRLVAGMVVIRDASSDAHHPIAYCRYLTTLCTQLPLWHVTHIQKGDVLIRF